MNNSEIDQQTVSSVSGKKSGAASGGHRKVWIKRLLIVLGIAVVLVAAGALWSFVLSTRAVNDYIGAVDQQYKEIVAGENVDQPTVRLTDVAFGEVINSKYRQARDLEPLYSDLIERLRSYTEVMNVHNQLVNKFNTGINGQVSLDGNILELVGQLNDMVADRYSDQTEAINDIGELYQLVAGNTSFEQISSQMNKVLYDNDKWLGEEREAIEADRTEFQQAINSL